jgi:hypothetical protein
MRIERSRPATVEPQRAAPSARDEPRPAVVDPATRAPVDPARQAAARARFAATGGSAALAAPAAATTTTKVARAFVREHAADGLSRKETRKALALGATPDQIEQWAGRARLSEGALSTLDTARAMAAPGVDPQTPFTAGGRSYASAEAYVRFQAAEGKLTGEEVEIALRRGASPDQIEQWAEGQTISDGGRLALAAARTVASTQFQPPPTTTTTRPTPPTTTTTRPTPPPPTTTRPTTPTPPTPTTTTTTRRPTTPTPPPTTTPTTTPTVPSPATLPPAPATPPSAPLPPVASSPGLAPGGHDVVALPSERPRVGPPDHDHRPPAGSAEGDHVVDFDVPRGPERG